MREVAYHHIQRKISMRQLRAGEPVSDVAISKELGISRTPAREAIRQLVSEGLLGSGARARRGGDHARPGRYPGVV